MSGHAKSRFRRAAKAEKRRARAPLDPIDAAEQVWTSEVPKDDAQAYALSTRILYVASLVEWSFALEAQNLGLNIGEVLLLDALRRFGPPYEASPAQLKAHFLISFAGIGKRIERLERLSYVERRPHATDRRSQIIRLTPAGWTLLHKHETDVHSLHFNAIMKLPRADRQSLAALLKKLQKGIETAKDQTDERSK